MSIDKQQVATAAATVGRGQRAKPESKPEPKPEVPATSPDKKERE